MIKGAKRCRTCAFRARGINGDVMSIYTCDYNLLTNQLRGCPAGEACTKYLPDSPEVQRLLNQAKHRQVNYKFDRSKAFYPLAAWEARTRKELAHDT